MEMTQTAIAREVQERVWIDPCVLPRFAALVALPEVRMLADYVLEVQEYQEYRSDEDRVLAALLPETRLHIEAYYKGRGKRLVDVFDDHQLETLDNQWSSKAVFRMQRWRIYRRKHEPGLPSTKVCAKRFAAKYLR